jgi:hypothetical protein
MIPNDPTNFDPTNNHSQEWENNHTTICEAFINLAVLKERLPTKTEIAAETNLSLRTVYNHLNHLGQQKIEAEYLQQFKIATGPVLAKIIELALSGDMRAARLYLLVNGLITKPQNPQTE